MGRSFTLSDFNYHLPEELIAQQPASPRDAARLLVYNRKDGSISDRIFSDLPELLHPNTTLAVNNSKVEKCRIRFNNIEVFVTQAVNNTTVEAMVRPGRKFKLGKTVQLSDTITAEVLNIADDGIRTLKFNIPMDAPEFDTYRLTPLPPYIQQDESLADEYQTVYAKPLGSKAAPTAGLHFTDALIEKLKKDHAFAELTLHVGLGTFAPVKEEDISKHKMHSEFYSISEESAKLLNEATHITAVGTTSVRTLESAIRSKTTYEACSGDTDIFITPGYEWQKVDSLITNFHLPQSTLLMLVSALIGYDECMSIYEHAVKEKYRFFSFGDAMIIL